MTRLHDRWPDWKLPKLSCENGHVFTTAFPASFTGHPCPDCGKPLIRLGSKPEKVA